MNKFILSIALSVGILAGSANAQVNTDVDAMCTSLSELGFSIVQMRQSGVPVYTAREIMHDEIYQPWLRRLVDAMTTDAYNLPKLYSKENINTQAAEFANDVYYQCVTNLGSTS